MNAARILEVAREVKAEVYRRLADGPPEYRHRVAEARFEVSARMTCCAGRAWPKNESVVLDAIGREVRRNVHAGLVRLSLPIFSDPRNACRAEEELRATVRHELAHLAAPFGACHGPEWKAAALACGARPERCHDLAVVRGPRRARKPMRWWRITCASCGAGLGKVKRRDPMRLLERKAHAGCPEGGRGLIASPEEYGP